MWADLVFKLLRFNFFPKWGEVWIQWHYLQRFHWHHRYVNTSGTGTLSLLNMLILSISSAWKSLSGWNTLVSLHRLLPALSCALRNPSQWVLPLRQEVQAGKQERLINGHHSVICAYLTLRSWEQLRTGELSSGTAGKGDNYLEMDKKKTPNPKIPL